MMVKRVMMVLLVGWYILVLAADVRPESTAYSSIGGIRIEMISEGFDLRNDLIELIENTIIGMLEVYKQQLGVVMDPSSVITIRVFGRFRDYKDYQRKISMVMDANTGFYSSRTKEVVTWANESEGEMLSIIFHEASHAILHSRLKNIPPRWLDEGLAEFFEYSEQRDERLLIQPQEHKALRIRKLLKKKDAFDLGKYFQLNDEEWIRLDKTQDRLTSSLSWSLVTFFMSHEEGRATLRAMLQHLDRHGQEFFKEVIEQSYPGGIFALEKAWRRFCLQGEKSYSYHFEHPSNTKVLRGTKKWQ
jgi:hypothetical protein